MISEHFKEKLIAELKKNKTYELRKQLITKGETAKFMLTVGTWHFGFETKDMNAVMAIIESK